jgi:hypothetical protein
MAAEDEQFIREVEEEYRRDRIAQFWRRYSTLIVAALLLLLIGIGGWRYWQHSQAQTAQAAAVRFYEASELAEQGKHDEARAAFESLAADAPGGYALLTRFRLAAELGRTDAEGGATAYDALAADDKINPVWQDLARLRASMLRFDNADPAKIRPDLERLAGPEQVWRHTARELLGLSGLKAGDYEFASQWFDRIAADRETPAGLRQRLEIYTALVAGGPVASTQ